MNQPTIFSNPANPAAERGRRKVMSLCGMCAVRCPIQVEVQDGRAVWLQGNPNDKGMGGSICAKGAAGLAFEYDAERPQQPLILAGPRGSGQWRRASWDEALDFVAGRLQDVIGRLGGRAVALSDRGGPFTDLTKSFLKALGSPNYFNHDCTCARNVHHAALSLFGWGRKGFAYDLKNARHILLVGRNLLESLQVKEAKAFLDAMAAGAKCTYVDVRATVTASKASRFLMIRPNTEYALYLALIRQVLQEGLFDAAFVQRWCLGLDELREAVEACSPQWAEAQTGIAAGEIVDLARALGAAAPQVVVHPGWMTARHRQSFYSARAAYILNALLGAIETPGGLIIAKTPADAGKKGLNKLGDRIPAVAEERVDGAGGRLAHFDGEAGLMHLMYEAIQTGLPYPLGAYIAYRHDPLVSLPDPQAQLEALAKLDLVVAIDVNYSETAWHAADVILPEATYLERANLLAVKNGPRPEVIMRDQAIEPRYDARPAWWIFRELARRLGVGQYFDYDGVEDLWRYQLEGSGLELAELRAKGFVSLAGRPILWDRAEGLKFKTPSGKIELASSRLAQAGLPSLPPYAPPPELAPGRFRLVFGRPAFHNHGHTMNNPLLNELMPENSLWMHPDPAEALGLAEGDLIEVQGDGGERQQGRLSLTPWLHPEAVFLYHGFGRRSPWQSRTHGRGIADQRLQTGLLHSYDPAGGGNNLTECVVTVRRA
ncbi:MAG: molybdopterin-dependent oxidoreductase [Thermodesulfobacteriota bacterium]